MTHPRDRRTLSQRQALRQRARRIQKSSLDPEDRKARTKRYWVQVIFVILLIAIIAAGSVWVSSKL